MRDSIRAFVAIDLPKHVKEDLLLLLSQLRKVNIKAIRWADPENIHVTVKFLGDTDPQQVPAILEYLTTTTRTFDPFQLNLQELGAFPTMKAPRVLWASLGGNLTSLNLLHASVEKSLMKTGFDPETRPFAPHLTLGRVRLLLSSKELIRLVHQMQNTPMPPVSQMTIRGLTLFRSTMRPDGSVYERLGTVRFRTQSNVFASARQKNDPD